MALVGMLHYRSDPRKVKKSYAFASVAKVEGIDFFYFTPGKINFKTRIIHGKVLKNGEWVEQIFPFPDVVYNAGTSSCPNSKAKINKLRKMVPFTSHSVGTKNKVYNEIGKSLKFFYYLIPFDIISNKEIIYKYLERYQKIILKPTSGHQGEGIYYVEKVSDTYLVIEKTAKGILDKSAFDQFIDSAITQNAYLVQKYITCKTKNGNTFDFRIHIQKNCQGKWVVTTIYGRIGPDNSIITNLSNGGSAIEFKPLLKQLFPRNHETLARKMNSLGLKLGAYLDKRYGKSFDELGIDVGIDKRGRIRIYEVNWRPGAPAIFYLELDVVKNSLQYAVHLANKEKM